MNRFAARSLLAGSLCLVYGSDARAQCPDGAPPPCRSATVAVARRANPALNDRAWIVVPFGNVTKAPDMEWLRDASVNLLSLDLSRWTDITVVDDKRVTDLVRELPSARASQPLSLSDGLVLARRAGAGRLVMGDVVKMGKGARLVANVFNVRDGSRIRTVAQQASDQDSLLTAFGPLARGVLAVPPPPDTKLGTIGTTSVNAYQEYLHGIGALNRFELTSAKQHLLKALALDSSFALAHYKLSVAIHWGDTRTDTAEGAHAVAAARLGRSLPARERALISARVASSSGDYVRACATLGGLAARDSSDAEVLYNLGECKYHAGYMTPEPIDSVYGRFLGDWNGAIAAFRRVLQLDPSYHPAFEHILDMLNAGTFALCRVQGPGCSNSGWNVVVSREGDSLVIRPVASTTAANSAELRRAELSRSPLMNLRAAREIAQQWVEAGPGEARGHLNLANVQLLLGEVEQADRELREIGTRDEYVRQASLKSRIEVAAILGRGGEGRALLDTLRRELPDGPGSNRDLGPLYAMFGKTARLEAWIDQMAAERRWSAERHRYMRHVPRLMIGEPRASLPVDERRYWESLPGDSLCAAGRAGCRTTALLPSFGYAARMPRTWWPPQLFPLGFRFYTAYAVSRRDATLPVPRTSRLDSIARSRLHSGSNDAATSLLAAEAYLAAGDSTKALVMTRLFVDSVMPAIRRMSSSVGEDDDWSILFVPRMMLLRADLAAAAGQREEARTWYPKVLELWAEADADLQPTVARIRAALGRTATDR